MERCPDCVCVQQDILLFCYRSHSETYVKKKFLERNKNLVALECTLQIGNEHVTLVKERASDWRCVWPGH
jgi:hypothetical protein